VNAWISAGFYVFATLLWFIPDPGIEREIEKREEEYTKPGYEVYARCVVEELVRGEQVFLRTTKERKDRSMWGSSLGGVVSFYTVWQYPDVFGSAACMSSTFSYKDDLLDRVLSEPKRQVGFYLDSGWPGDNYEGTIAMALALVSRAGGMGATFFTCVFHMPRMMRKPGGRGYTCRCSCSPAWSRAPRVAVIRCGKIRPNSRCAGSDDDAGYMLARHIKPKKIVFHSRLLPHETCRMNRAQHLKPKKGFLVFSRQRFRTTNLKRNQRE
jgi:pimeloyl-ACP methyl ester carboxylesterase